MTKWREDRYYEILEHLNNNKQLHAMFVEEFQKSQYDYPAPEHFTQLEKCYEIVKKKYESL